MSFMLDLTKTTVLPVLYAHNVHVQLPVHGKSSFTSKSVMRLFKPLENFKQPRSLKIAMPNALALKGLFRKAYGPLIFVFPAILVERKHISNISLLLLL